jgi:hypothetical protein
VIQASNPRTQGDEAGKWQIQGQFRLQTLSLKTKANKKTTDETNGI